MNEIEIVEIAKRGALLNSRMSGSLMPVFFLKMTDGKTNIVGTPWSSEEEKDKISSMLFKLISNNMITEFVFVCECWVVRNNNMQEIMRWKQEHGSLENHPDRAEMLNIVYSTSQKEIMYASNMLRNEDGSFKDLDKWESLETSGPKVDALNALYQPRFNGLWAKARVGDN